MNRYICFYKGKQVEVYAETSYAAQQKAAQLLKAKRIWDVIVLLATVCVVEHDGGEL